MELLTTLTPAARRLLWCAVLGGLLLATLDQTIVGTALPTIVGELGGGQWYVWGIAAYLVPATVLIPVFARLSDRYGRQRMLLTGMGVFVVGSGLCAVAGSMAQLCSARALQGCGAAALEALCFVLVVELSGPARAASAQASMAAVMALGFLGGPLLGGLLADSAGWRWAFLVNVPLGLAAMAVIGRHLPAPFGQREGRSVPVDVTGILALTTSAGAALVGLGQHAVVGTWADPRTGGLVAVGLVGLAWFARVERRAVAPLLPPRLLRDRGTGGLLAAGATASWGLFASVLLLPRLLQLAMGTTATEAGLLMYSLLVALLVGINLAVVVVTRTRRLRAVLLGANALVVLAAAGFAALADGSPLPWLVALCAALGLGLGPGLSGTQLGLGRMVAPVDLGAALGALLLVRQLGGAVALAAAEAVHAGRLAGGATQAAATGTALAVVAGAGGLLASAALLRLRGRAARLPLRRPDAGPVPAPQPVTVGRAAGRGGPSCTE